MENAINNSRERQGVLSAAGDFGAFPPARLEQFRNLVAAQYPEQRAFAVQDVSLFAGAAGTLLLSSTHLNASPIAGHTLEIAPIRDLYSRAVAAGLVPESIVISVQIATEMPFDAAAERLFRFLPWVEAVESELVGSGTRYVFRRGVMAFELAFESDFNRHDQLLYVAKCTAQAALPHADAFTAAQEALHAIRNDYFNAARESIIERI